jgi:hypothetical protein
MSLQNVSLLPANTFPKPPGAFERLGEIFQGVILEPLDAVGLLERPVLRGAIFGGLVAGAVLYLRPEAQFSKEGQRPWSLLHPQDPNATPFPWFVVAGTVGVMTALMI